jgi:hypothetical protein
MNDEPPPPETNPVVEPQPEAAPEVDEVQTRINAIYGQKKQAEENFTAAVRENQELRTRLLAADERQAVQNRIAGRSQPEGAVSPISSSGAPAQHDELGAIRMQLEGVNRALAQQRLESLQAQSAKKATQMIPGLAAGDKRLMDAAADIFARDEVLRSHPHGPMLAAALAAQLQNSPQTPSAAQRAGVTTPTPGVFTAMSQGAAGKQLEAAQAELASVTEKMRQSGGSEYWAKYQKLREQVQELKTKTKG